MLSALLAPKFVLLYIYIASAIYVHYRGRVRHGFFRQVTDHSTLMAPYNALMYLFSAVPNRPYVEVSGFPELAPLAENWQTIRREAQQLLESGRIRSATTYNDLGFNSFFKTGWKRFYVKWYDQPLPSAQALCPKTVALVQSIPSINGAMFAMLPPGGKLGKHRDPFAGSLRYHLGLATPNSAECNIHVDGQPYFWRDGEAVMFDETFIHWAENKTDVRRVILFCDVERPLTSRVMTRINKWYKKHVISASQTENVTGDKVGWLNRVFSLVYYLRVPGKALKHRFRALYYVVKWAILLLLAWWAFAPLLAN
jgi:beta-hydroxylase